MGKPTLFAVVICPGCLDVYLEEQPETCDTCGVATVAAILKPRTNPINKGSLFLPQAEGIHLKP